MAMALRVVVPPHPLLSHWLTVLRDHQTPQPLFATAMAELGRWLSYEALRDWLPQRELELQTPVATVTGQVVDPSVPLLAIVALPAGLGLWQGAQAVLPAAQLALIGPDQQGVALPKAIGPTTGILLVWPQLDEPEPLLALLDHLAEQGISGQRLRLITTVAAAPALHSIGERHGALTLYTAAIDPDLDEQGRIVPGIGPVTSRLLGYGESN